MNILITESEIKSHSNDYELGQFIRDKYWKIFDNYDECVLCGKKSPYRIDTNIDVRIGYIEGSGQGCFQIKKCEY